jgi:trimethylamine monooxygenase
VEVFAGRDPLMLKICVIGAGPSALSLLHFLKDSKKIEIQVFEKQGEVGGMWTDLDSWRVGISFNYSFRQYNSIGTDQFGLPCHHSMYKDLWSNGPKEALEYADYSFRDHFKKNIGSFPPRSVIKVLFCFGMMN